MNKAERIHKILGREDRYFLVTSLTGQCIGGVDYYERLTYIALFNQHNQIDELDEKTKQECINRIRTNGKRIDNLQYDYLNLSMIQGWFFNLKEIMSFQKLGETEYLRQINEPEYNRLLKKIGELRTKQIRYNDSDPEHKSIETKIEELTQRRGQFADWFIARNLDIPYDSSQITATANTEKAETENRKEQPQAEQDTKTKKVERLQEEMSSVQKTKAKPAYRPMTKITQEGLHEFAALSKKLKVKEENLTKTGVKEIMAKKYNCDATTYPNWLRGRVHYVDTNNKNDIWALDENAMDYLWDNYYTLPTQEKD